MLLLRQAIATLRRSCRRNCLSRRSLRRRALPVPPPVTLSTSMADSLKLFPKKLLLNGNQFDRNGLPGGCGPDNVLMICLCRYTIAAHAPNLGARSPGSKLPATPAPTNPRQLTPVSHRGLLPAPQTKTDTNNSLPRMDVEKRGEHKK